MALNGLRDQWSIILHDHKSIGSAKETKNLSAMSEVNPSIPYKPKLSGKCICSNNCHAWCDWLILRPSQTFPFMSSFCPLHVTALCIWPFSTVSLCLWRSKIYAHRTYIIYIYECPAVCDCNRTRSYREHRMQRNVTSNEHTECNAQCTSRHRFAIFFLSITR